MPTIKPEKISLTDILVEPLSEKHKPFFNSFKSFEKELSDFLIQDALDNQEKRISKTHLWFYKPTKQLIGYVTLLNDKISLEAELKQKRREKGTMPMYLDVFKLSKK